VKKLKVLPAMRCDAGCGECCGVIPVTETEYRRVERFAREHGIVPVDHGASGDKLTCPFYQGQMLPGFDAEAAGYTAGLLVRTGQTPTPDPSSL
jgi:hypothetical protein